MVNEYERYMRKARREFTQGLAATTDQVKEVYRRAASGIRDDITRLTPGTLRYSHLTALQTALDRRAEEMSQEVLAAAHQGIWFSSKTASAGVANATADMVRGAFDERNVQRLFAGVNEQATLAMLARTRKDGLKISDRVWRTSENARNNLQKVLEDAVARGQDARTTAKQVDRYLQPGIWKAHKKETRRKLGVGTDVSYQAMRLTRTEMSNAFHEGTVASNQHCPGYRGIHWLLSNRHVIQDICTDMSSDMSHGEPGFYPKGEEPTLPHPNCLCVVESVYEDPDQFVERLREWMEEPASQPDIESWYTANKRWLGGRPFVIAPPVEALLPKDRLLREAEEDLRIVQKEADEIQKELKDLEREYVLAYQAKEDARRKYDRAPRDLFADAQREYNQAIREHDRINRLMIDAKDRVDAKLLEVADAVKRVSDPTIPKMINLGNITDFEYLGGGVSKTYKATLGGKKHILKSDEPVPVMNMIAGNAEAEVLASRIFREIGLDAPKAQHGLAVLPNGARQKFVATEFIDQKETVEEFLNKTRGMIWEERFAQINQDEFRKMQVVDVLIGNTDRHAGNFFIGVQGRIIPIDHNLTFVTDNIIKKGITWQKGFLKSTTYRQAHQSPKHILKRNAISENMIRYSDINDYKDTIREVKKLITKEKIKGWLGDISITAERKKEIIDIFEYRRQHLEILVEQAFH